MLIWICQHTILFYSWIIFLVWISYILLIHLSIGRHLGCLYLSANMNNAATSIHVQIFISTYVFISLEYKYPGVALLDFFGRNDAQAETLVLWPPHAKSWLIGKDSDAGRDWGQEEKGTTEDEMTGWHHQLDGHESGWTPGVGDEQGGLLCCDSWGRKESDTTKQLNWTELKHYWII